MSVQDVRLKDPFGGTITDGNFTSLLDDSVSGVIYIGKAQVGADTVSGRAAALWQIEKIDTTNAPKQVSSWANGTDLFDKIWDNRATYTYS